MTEFKEYLKESAEFIEHSLSRIWTKTLPIVKRESPTSVFGVEEFINSCRGGKRLRGSLVRLSHDLIDPKPNISIFDVAAAIEITQATLLVQDDVFDNSLTRRNLPTLHLRLDQGEYGKNVAVILGIYGQALAPEIILDSDFSPDNKLKALKAYHATMQSTGLGEIEDLTLAKSRTLTQADIYRLYDLKTAQYTFVQPMQVGAALAGANNSYLDAVKNFGHLLGIAFQIQDDIIGVFGDEELTGKSTSSDIQEGKNTILLLKALQKAKSKERKFILENYGDQNVDQKGIETIREIFIKTGSLDYSKEQVVHSSETARKIIPQLTSQPDHQQLLDQMINMLISRSS